MRLKNKYVLYAALLLAAFTLQGCAGINPFEAPQTVLNHPLGTESIGIGMSKQEVLSVWGKPDITNKLGFSDSSGTQIEEWIYKARDYSPVSVDAGYLSKNKYLYFDGNNLTKISNEPK